jgi:NADH-quinone oxidoreductase subunit B
MGLESKLPEGAVLTTTLEKMVNWSRLLFGLACCAIEMMHAGVSRHDISRFGAEVFRASPRQADVMIVSGRISQKMAPVVKRIYEQMPEPKWVIAMGACASSGGMFNNVDVYVPGCPPRPEALIYAITKLQKKMEQEKFKDRA